jgi:hypothetical protein
VIDAGARGHREHLRDNGPNLDSMLDSDDVSDDLLCKRVDDEPEHSLIPTNPCKVGRIGDNRLLLVGVFDLDGLLRGRFGAIKESEGKGPADRRKDEGVPKKGSLTSSASRTAPSKCGGQGRSR